MPTWPWMSSRRAGLGGFGGTGWGSWGVSVCAALKELLRVLRFGFYQSASTKLLCLLLDFVPQKPWRAKPETEMARTSPSTGVNLSRSLKTVN